MTRSWLLLCLLASPTAYAPAAFAGAADDRQLIGQLDREVIALKLRIRALEDGAKQCGTSGEPSPIYAELTQAFAGQPIVVTRVGAETRVTIPEQVLFSNGGMTMREEGQFAMDLLATGLKGHADLDVMVVGHGDGEPPTANLRKLYPTPWELTAIRADIVARELIEGYGVSPHRFTVAARGEQEPVASGDTPEGRAQNRRIVVHISPGAPK